jgi:hypothetical protein
MPVDKSVDEILTLTPDDWDVYEMRGINQITKRCNNFLYKKIKSARTALIQNATLDKSKVGQDLYNVVSKYMRKYSSFGFGDTEPSIFLCILIEKYLDLNRYTICR